MPDPTAATYRFFSWLRQGLLAGLSNNAGSGAPATAGHLSLPISLRVNNIAPPAGVTVELYGPGDITGIDAREVIRTDPHAHMTDFEPNYFPAIEFDRPDFPWLFTPAHADAARRLRPWICLVVVHKEGATIRTAPQQPLPALTCAREELPNLDHAWAWAHAQIVTGDTTAPNPSLQQILQDHPERTLSRLLGARRLDPNTAYYACLVPTYDVGRKAGLGEPITTAEEQALNPAWTTGPGTPAAPITLPVYFHWEFRTGQAGDFESLARRLKAAPLPATVGLRPLDIRTPGWGMPALSANAPGGLLDLGGALRTPDTTPRPWPDPAQTSFQQSLRNILNGPAAHTSPNEEPAVLGPPLYGQWYTDQLTVPAATQSPHWFRELNLDPRHRVAAGIGTQVIRQEQEPLMASAWDQLEQQRQHIQRRKRAQLSESVGDSLLAKHLRNLDATRLLQLTGPVFTGMTGSPTTATPVNNDSQKLLRNPAVSGAFRRLTRAGGPIRARAAAPQPTASSLTTTPQTQPGTVALFAAATSTQRAPTATAWTAVQAEVLMRLNPKETVLAAVRKSQPETEQIDLIRFAPTFPDAMYRAMRDSFPDMLLPGMGLVPQNSIALLKTNQELIEAYMVGLNHEMSRELLWRGFPTDQRGTYFRQFWDAAGEQPPTTDAEREVRQDITPIASWTADSRLGTHSPRGRAEGQMVLLIRGDLLRRYPRAIVYALEGVWSADGTRRELGTIERYPIFRANQLPDLTMLGFPLTEAEVRGADSKAGGHPGWFFLLQEQPTEPRFGLDVATTYGGTPQQWRDLTWGHLAADAAGLAQIAYVPLDGLLKNVTVDQIPWGANSAQMATITRQPPFRVAVHARTWLPAVHA